MAAFMVHFLVSSNYVFACRRAENTFWVGENQSFYTELTGGYEMRNDNMPFLRPCQNFFVCDAFFLFVVDDVIRYSMIQMSSYTWSTFLLDIFIRYVPFSS